MNDFGVLVAEYNSSLPTLSDGDTSELQVDSNGRLLVQADVSVIIDFLGLNGAGDSSNILMIGTEDGTSGGTAHAVRLATDGSVIIDDGGGSITVDGAVDASQAGTWSVQVDDGTDTLQINADGSINITDNGGSLTVDATDLDIRDLSAAQDNVAISDGTDTLDINTDGSINANIALDGAEEYGSSDSAGDGIESITTSFSDLVTISVGSGETLYIYGFQFDADVNSFCRLIVDDNGTPSDFLKVRQTTSTNPGVSEHWTNAARIEITGAANRSVILQARGKTQSGNASASVHSRKLT